MKTKDFTTETLEVFSWLESELGCTREVTHFRHVYFIEKIKYKKDNITITIVCDNRDYELFFEIFVTTQDRNLCISEEAELFKLEHVSEGQRDVKYESVFNYTKDSLNEKQFKYLKTNTELQLRKREGRKKYLDLLSQLIKVAVETIEVQLS